jgi:hypothetical protein
VSISLDEAEEALAAIQQVTQKTRRSIASSGAYIFLIITGIIWLVGYFLLKDFFYLWMAILVGGGMIALGFYIHSRW